MAFNAEITEIREDRISLFRNLEGPNTHRQFFDRVADDVDWTVEGTHPLAGRYRSKQDFIHGAFDRWAPILEGGQQLALEQSTSMETQRSRSCSRRRGLSRAHYFRTDTAGCAGSAATRS